MFNRSPANGGTVIWDFPGYNNYLAPMVLTPILQMIDPRYMAAPIEPIIL